MPNKDRLINWIVLLLVAVGLVFVIDTLISMSPYEAFKEVTEKSKYISLPLAIAIKGFQYLDRKFKSIEEIRTIALSNRGNDDSLKELIRFIRDDFISSRVETTEALSELDRRMIKLEALSEVSSSLARHERMFIEVNDRLNKL